MKLRTLSTLALLFAGAALAPRSAEGSLAASAPVLGTEFLRVDEALELAFPKCEIKRGTVYLTKDQKKTARELAKLKVEVNILHPYEAFDAKGEHVGTAYFDSHRVRTKNETLMVVVSPEDQITRIEVCAFGEPTDYIPSGRWYGQFLGKGLDDELNLKRGIRGVTGATLTAQATTDCARRVLALHEAVKTPEPQPEPKPVQPAERR